MCTLGKHTQGEILASWKSSTVPGKGQRAWSSGCAAAAVRVSSPPLLQAVLFSHAGLAACPHSWVIGREEWSRDHFSASSSMLWTKHRCVLSGEKLEAQGPLNTWHLYVLCPPGLCAGGADHVVSEHTDRPLALWLFGPHNPKVGGHGFLILPGLDPLAQHWEHHPKQRDTG